jgi:hypothetical protein
VGGFVEDKDFMIQSRNQTSYQKRSLCVCVKDDLLQDYMRCELGLDSTLDCRTCMHAPGLFQHFFLCLHVRGSCNFEVIVCEM